MKTKTLKASTEFAPGKNNIAWVGSNFKEYFYGMDLILSKSAPFETRTLERDMYDKEILEELKPEPVTLGAILASLKEASHDHWYIFYVNDKESILRAVHAGWYRDGWGIGASPVSDPRKWHSGHRVVSQLFAQALEFKTLSDSALLTFEARVAALEEWRERVQQP